MIFADDLFKWLSYCGNSIITRTLLKKGITKSSWSNDENVVKDLAVVGGEVHISNNSWPSRLKNKKKALRRVESLLIKRNWRPIQGKRRLSYRGWSSTIPWNTERNSTNNEHFSEWKLLLMSNQVIRYFRYRYIFPIFIITFARKASFVYL